MPIFPRTRKNEFLDEFIGKGLIPRIREADSMFTHKYGIAPNTIFLPNRCKCETIRLGTKLFGLNVHFMSKIKVPIAGLILKS